MEKPYKILLGILIIISLYLSITNIFYPSYLSVYSSCNPIEFNETFGDKYYVAGNVQVDSTGEEDNVTIYISDLEDIKTIKHEYIHLFQYSQDRLYGCNHIALKYLNEVEAYTFSNLPNDIYSRIYPNDFLTAKNS